MSDALLQAQGHSVAVIAFRVKVAEETLKNTLNSVRRGLLRLDMIQEAGQDQGVPVEENNLDVELLTYIMPRPEQAVYVREGGVEQDGGYSLGGCACSELET